MIVHVRDSATDATCGLRVLARDEATVHDDVLLPVGRSIMERATICEGVRKGKRDDACQLRCFLLLLGERGDPTASDQHSPVGKVCVDERGRPVAHSGDDATCLPDIARHRL
jgi:hypothetical protein